MAAKKTVKSPQANLDFTAKTPAEAKAEVKATVKTTTTAATKVIAQTVITGEALKNAYELAHLYQQLDAQHEELAAQEKALKKKMDEVAMQLRALRQSSELKEKLVLRGDASTMEVLFDDYYQMRTDNKAVEAFYVAHGQQVPKTQVLYKKLRLFEFTE